MKQIIFTSLLALLAAQSSLRAATIVDWDFDAAGTVAAPDNTPAPSTGTGTATELGMNNSYTFNGGEGPGSVAESDVLATSGASTGTGAYAWRVRGASNSSGGGAGQANGWNSAAPIATQGAQFDVSTTGYTALTLTFDLNATTQAERNLTVEYTLDDSVSNPVWLVADITSAGSTAVLASNSSSANTVAGNYVKLVGTGTGWNNGITATFGLGSAQDPNFAFEIVNASTGADDVNTGGSALNNSSGNWRYDNVELSGTVAVATPEPSTWALVGFGGLALLVLRRLKNRRA